MLMLGARQSRQELPLAVASPRGRGVDECKCKLSWDCRSVGLLRMVKRGGGGRGGCYRYTIYRPADLRRDTTYCAAAMR